LPYPVQKYNNDVRKSIASCLQQPKAKSLVPIVEMQKTDAICVIPQVQDIGTARQRDSQNAPAMDIGQFALHFRGYFDHKLA
jgi:hypothetical protein